ncbi:MAG: hypothetical protein JEZ00_08980 [Anaerolineaceae bacterium]|nr:hypothetical protein [Anaerolineaceae bacterium]
MGNYKFTDGVKPAERKVHPVWRGIGCVLMILNPIMAYAGMILLLQLNRQNGWFRIPYDLYVEGKDPLLLVKGLVFLVLLFLLFSVYALFSFLVQRIAGPSRFGLYDVPPVIYKGKRYKR